MNTSRIFTLAMAVAATAGWAGCTSETEPTTGDDQNITSSECEIDDMLTGPRRLPIRTV